jgi:hydrogenase expression/formation protein HypC
MCVEIPALVVSVDADGLSAMVKAEHGIQPVLLLTLDTKVKPGDWLLVHSGLAVQRLSANEARDLLDFAGRARLTKGLE